MISGNKRTKEVKYEVFSTTYWRFSSVTRFCCFRLCTNLTCVVAVWEASYIFLGSVLSQYVVMCVCLCVCNQPFSRNIAPRRTTFYDVARLIMMSPIYCWRNSTHFDVRPASVHQKLTILENSSPGPLAQYLNFFKHYLIINWKVINDKYFQRMEEFYHI